MVADTDIDGSVGRHLHVAGLAVSLITGIPQLILPVIAASYSGYGGRWGFAALAVFFLIMMLFGLFFRWMAWLRFSYFVGDDGIRIERGILFHNARSIPFSRIQDVSIEQAFIPRLLNLAEVGFETGGGKGQDAKLRYVSRDEAEMLRDLVRRYKAGEISPSANRGGDDTVELASDDGRRLFHMDNRRLLLFGLYSFSLIIIAVIFGAIQQFDFLLPADFWDWRNWTSQIEDKGRAIGNFVNGSRFANILLALILLPLAGFATGVVRVFLRDYGFRLDRVESGLRRRRGLLTHSDVVIPLHRVQAAMITTGPVRQWRGWYGVELVSLAADGGEKTGGGNRAKEDHIVAPFATMGEVTNILAETGMMPPAADISAQRGDYRWYMTLALFFAIPVSAIGISLQYFATDFPPAAVAILSAFALAIHLYLDWRFRQHHFDGEYLFIRSGWWRRRLMILPAVRIQTVELSQGPLSRLLGLVNMELGVAGGKAAIRALPAEIAHPLRALIAGRAAAIDYSRINQTA